MNRLENIRANSANCEYLLRRLRAADRAELKAGGMTIALAREAIIDAIGEGQAHAIVEIGTGRTVMMWGVDATGYVWALGTGLVEKHGREIAMRTRSTVDRLVEAYGPLWTQAYGHNDVHQRWLRHAGFTASTGRPDIVPPFLYMTRS